jgi:hypothetical protein
MSGFNEKVEELRQLLLTPGFPAAEALPPLADVEAAIEALDARLTRLRALRGVLLLLDQGQAPPGDFWLGLSPAPRTPSPRPPSSGRSRCGDRGAWPSCPGGSC